MRGSMRLYPLRPLLLLRRRHASSGAFSSSSAAADSVASGSASSRSVWSPPQTTAAAAVGNSGINTASIAMGCCATAAASSSPSMRVDEATKSTERAATIEARIASRVRERDSWPTSHTHPPGDVFRLAFRELRAGRWPPPPPDPGMLDRDFPVRAVDYDALRSPPLGLGGDDGGHHIQVTWVGHATVLLQVRGCNILTDPIFSRRCSAVQFMGGPERFRPPALTVADLVREGVPVHCVVLTHNHYDHLDYHSMRDLSELYPSSGERVIQFVVPLGLGRWFARNCPAAIQRHRVTELEWHETCAIDVDVETAGGGGATTRLQVTAVPMQHWSSRTGFDRDKTLWCGYSISASAHGASTDNDAGDTSVGEASTSTSTPSSTSRVLFAGDTGYFPGLRTEVGDRYGPFDLAALPIGAYEPRDFMRYQHMNPREAVRAMVDVRAARAVPIHFGTFQLTTEPVLEPAEGLVRAMEEAVAASTNERCRGGDGDDEGGAGGAACLEVDSFRPWLIGETILC